MTWCAQNRRLILAAAVFLCAACRCIRAESPEVVSDLSKSIDKFKVTNPGQPLRLEKHNFGGASTETLLQHPSGSTDYRAELKVALPAIAVGDRIELQFSYGLPDEADLNAKSQPSDGVQMAVELNGSRVFQMRVTRHGLFSEKIDLTSYAGRDLHLCLLTNTCGTDSWDWACWMSPRIVRYRAAGTLESVPIAASDAPESLLWLTDLQAARQLASETRSRILAFFLRAGDPASERVWKQVLQSPDTRPVMEKGYVLLRLDFGSDKPDPARPPGLKPTEIVIYDLQGSVLGQIDGERPMKDIRAKLHELSGKP